MAQGATASGTLPVVVAASQGKSSQCGGEDRYLEVGSDFAQAVEQLHVHKEFMCECLRTTLVTGTPHFSKDHFEVTIGVSVEESFDEGSAEFRMCKALEHLKLFESRFCSYMYGWQDMKDLCHEHLG